MKALRSTAPAPLFVEIGESSLKLLDGGSLEVPLERLANGRLTQPCRERLVQQARDFLRRKNWRSRPRAFCAISARGVSLRRLTLPPATKENFEPLLLLQLEKELPLAPDEFAWGHYPVRSPSRPGMPPAPQETIVAAVRKEVIEEYAAVLDECGIDPVFTLAGAAGSILCPPAVGACALLDLGRNHSELTVIENGTLTGIRVLNWGGEQITRSIAEALKIPREPAELLKNNWGAETGSESENAGHQVLQRAIQCEIESLASLIKTNGTVPKIYLTGKTARLPGLAESLAKFLGVNCERLEFAPGEGHSAALLGLKRVWESDGQAPLLTIELRGANARTEPVVPPSRWKWAALAALLVASLLLSRYGEAFAKKPGLEKRVSEIQARQEQLPEIDRELGFLQFMDKNQPAYLTALAAVANAAPSGTRIDSLTMNRRGDLSLRGSMRNAQQATDFRAKLLESGVFSSVVIEEQTPTPDRQKLNVRMSARWNSTRTR
jgi:Tfp pilus assembly PilM family ATPase